MQLDVSLDFRKVFCRDGALLLKARRLFLHFIEHLVRLLLRERHGKNLPLHFLGLELKAYSLQLVSMANPLSGDDGQEEKENQERANKIVLALDIPFFPLSLLFVLSNYIETLEVFLLLRVVGFTN